MITEREQQNEHLPKEQGTSLKTRQKKAETRGLKLVREKRYIIEILPITGYSKYHNTVIYGTPVL